MYQKSLEYGLLPEEVYNLSLAELSDVLEAKQAHMLEERKMRALMLHSQSLEIAMHVGRIFSEEKDKGELPKIWDVYPGIFDDDRKAAEEKESEELLMKQKAAMEIYMAAMNSRFEPVEEGEANDT